MVECNVSIWNFRCKRLYAKRNAEKVSPGPRDTDNIGKVTRSKVKVNSDGCRNLVNAIAPEPLTGFEPKLTRTFPTAGPITD